jgi:hypothetical protein
LWVQFEALVPKRPTYDPAHPLGCHRRRIDDRIIFDKLADSPAATNGARASSTRSSTSPMRSSPSVA